MPGFALRPRLDNGEKIFAAWMSSGHARLAEAAVSVGFDTVVFDLQHGEATLAQARDGIAAARLAGKPAGIRAGLDSFGEAARLLDLGAELAIMPMVNSAEEARRLVDTLEVPAPWRAQLGADPGDRSPSHDGGNLPERSQRGHPCFGYDRDAGRPSRQSMRSWLCRASTAFSSVRAIFPSACRREAPSTIACPRPSP